MTRLCFIWVLMILFSSCSRKPASTDDILPREKMVKVFWDVLKADAYAKVYVSKDSTKNVQMEDARLQQKVFALHQITPQQFSASYNFYSSHHVLMIGLIDSMATLAQREKINYSPASLDQRDFKRNMIRNSVYEKNN